MSKKQPMIKKSRPNVCHPLLPDVAFGADAQRLPQPSLKVMEVRNVYNNICSICMQLYGNIIRCIAGQ